MILFYNKIGFNIQRKNIRLKQISEKQKIKAIGGNPEVL